MISGSPALGTRSELHADLRTQCGFVGKTYIGVDHLASLEKYHSGNGAHAVLGGDFAGIIDIDLGDGELAGELLGEVLKQGRDGLAGPAPRGPEVHQDRSGRLGDGIGKSGGGELGDVLGHGSAWF